MSDRVTILLADEHVGKTWARSVDGEWTATAYPNIYRWIVRTREVADLDALADLLGRVAEYGRACMIRGVPLADYGESPVRRLTRDDEERGDPATFQSAPDGLHWICVDVDGDDIPCDVDPRHDPDGYADVARQVLPDELADGRCFYQLSSSAGIKPGVRVHLFFWLDRRTTDDALREWADNTPHVDPQVFVPVQPHYVATPTFRGPTPESDGWPVDLGDPIPRRTGWLDGTPTVWPDGLLTPDEWREREAKLEAEREAERKRWEAKRRRRRASRSHRANAMWDELRARRAIESSVEAICSAPQGSRNEQICRRANFLGRVCASGVLDLSTAQAELERAAERALAGDWPARKTATLESIERCLSTGFSAGDTDV